MTNEQIETLLDDLAILSDALAANLATLSLTDIPDSTHVECLRGNLPGIHAQIQQKLIDAGADFWGDDG